MPSLAAQPAWQRAIAHWPAHQPLGVLWSAPFQTSRQAADPVQHDPHAGPLGSVRLLRPRCVITDALPPHPGHAPPGHNTDHARTHDRAWLGFVSYDHGRAIEPRATHADAGASRVDRAWPRTQWLRFDTGAHHDVGEPEPSHGARAHGGDAYTLGAFTSATGRDRFVRDAARVIEYLRAGDAYQVNLAHRLSAPFSGSARALAIDLFTRARPRFGAYIELPDDPVHGGGRRAIISLSPELFLTFDPRTRTLTTRPMKGTRRAASPRDAAALTDSAKDQAELNMIVDLMRNDLTRVCDVPSVRVVSPRNIESHERGGLLQATATVEGRLREGATLGDILNATFPPGSVTGAPKIRAMQIIDELEPVSRGPYCGCIGVVCDDGALEFSVAIRTALISGTPAQAGRGCFERAVLDYSVGAGVTVRSDPDAEWQETLDKAALIASLAAPTREVAP